MAVSTPRPIIFSTAPYANLAARICALQGYEQGHIKAVTHPDQEWGAQILSDVQDRHVLLIGGTISEKDIVQLLFLSHVLVGDCGAASLTHLNPYFGFQTQERPEAPGVAVTAKYMANILSHVPLAPNGNMHVLLDTHTPGIPFYFEGNVRARLVSADSLFIRAARSVGGNERRVWASVDSGQAKHIATIAAKAGGGVALGYKERDSDTQIKKLVVLGNVQGALVFIKDDMARTCGSVLAAAKAFKEAGASRIIFFATHGVFTEGSVEKLQQSGLIEHVVVTDSHPNAVAHESDFVEVVSVAEVYAEFLNSVAHLKSNIVLDSI